MNSGKRSFPYELLVTTSDRPTVITVCGVRFADRISTAAYIVTLSFVCSLITHGDSNQQDQFALQLYGEFNWKNDQIGLLCSPCAGIISLGLGSPLRNA